MCKVDSDECKISPSLHYSQADRYQSGNARISLPAHRSRALSMRRCKCPELAKMRSTCLTSIRSSCPLSILQNQTNVSKVLSYRPKNGKTPFGSSGYYASHASRRPHLFRRSRKQLQHARFDRNDPPTALFQERRSNHYRAHPRQRRSADLPACRLPLFSPKEGWECLPECESAACWPAAIGGCAEGASGG